ncbi:MAG: helix-turn-helix domain-containing protein [Sphingomonadaceae bacterium]
MLNSDLIEGAQAAAEFIGLKRRQVYEMVERERLPVIRKGRRMYFRKSELERAFSSEAA